MIQNPILPGFNPDPCICRKGDDYYLAVSTFEWFPGIPIYHSRDLKHWELYTHVLTDDEKVDLKKLPSAKGIWAPCLTYCQEEDLFYVVYGVMNSMNARYFDVDNYLITAKDIRGPWSEPVYLHSSGFDASIFHDDNGKKYIVSLEWETRLGYEKPGSIWRYSNYGYGVIGLTLEQAYGKTLEEYVQSYFLQPMGIDASFYTASFSAEELASLYRGTTNEWSAANQAATRLPQGIGDAMSFFCGNFTSSAGDYAKLIALLANDGTYDGVFYLSPEAIDDMETPRLAANNGESDFQQCLTLRRKENVYGQEVLYYHTGSAYGVYALASYNPITRNGVVVISSGANRSIDEEGIYGLCASITTEAYRQIDAGKGTM